MVFSLPRARRLSTVGCVGSSIDQACDGCNGDIVELNARLHSERSRASGELYVLSRGSHDRT